MHEICPICLDNLEENVYTTGCKHSFHKECIQKHFVYSNNCPCCRRYIEVNEDDEINVKRKHLWRSFNECKDFKIEILQVHSKHIYAKVFESEDKHYTRYFWNMYGKIIKTY